MASAAKTVAEPLPQEMQQHTYSIMYQVEGAHWWFVGRRRIIESFVEQIFPETGNSTPRILDVGCGTGANLEMLSRFGAPEGVDVSADALAFCRARGLTDLNEGTAENLPYPDQTFDLVTGLDLVEHLDSDVAGLREMHRVLRPGGRILLFVPAFMFLWGVQDDISHHRRRYTLKELKRVVTEAGFTVERATYANITFFAPILVGRLLMRLTGFRPASENNLNVSALNGVLAPILGFERHFLKRFSFPFGVSAICVARRAD